MYTNRLARSIDQVNFNEDGEVIGVTPSLDENGTNLDRDELTINDQGYVIEEGTQYTTDESPLFIRNDQGAKVSEKTGDAIPDFEVGLSTTLSYNNLTLYALADWQQGGDVYNYTKQLLYFNERHAELDQSGRPEGQRHAFPYFESGRYNRGEPNAYFVEDGTFVKIREISLSYNFTPEFIEGIGLSGALYDAKFSVAGRNLFTFTGYDGYDPEVGVQGADNQPTNFRIDDFAYPNFRNYTASLELRF
jgi:hypothetical protein